MQILRQSTQVKVVIGPAVAVGDGFTPVTSLSLSTADEAEILKHDAASVTDISGATMAAITGADGYYNLTLTTSHTDTCGLMTVLINDDSLILPIKATFMVVEEAIYDSLFAASAAGFDSNQRVNVGRWLGTAVTTSSTTSKPEVDAYSISDDATAANNAELAFDGTGFGFTGCTMPTVTTLAGHTAQTGDSYARLGAPAGASVSADIAAVKVDTAATLVDTNELQTDWTNGGRLDLIIDAILVDTGTTLDDHLTDIKGTGFAKDTHSLTNIEGYADLIDDGTSGLAKIATDVAAILADTADMQPKLGTVPDLGSGATVGGNLTDIAGATFSSSTDSLEAIRDRGDAAWTTGAGGSDRLLMVDTTIATLASQTSFTLTAGSADNNAYRGCTIVIEDASTSTQKAAGIVDAYTGSTKTVTLLEDPGVFTMDVGDKVYILAEKSLKPTEAANYHADVNGTGNMGIDWGNVSGKTTSNVLSGTTIANVVTVTQPDYKIFTGTLGATGNDTTHLHLAGLGAAYGNDELNNLLIRIYDVDTTLYHSRWIDDWVSSSELATVAALPFTPQASTDTYFLYAIRRGLTEQQTRDAMKLAPTAGSPAAGSVDADLDTITTSVYHADIKLNVDEANTQDEYTVTWFKDGVRVTSGITSPTIQVVRRSNGTDLIASTAMTQIGSTGSYKYDEATNRVTAGEDAVCIVGATIDGSARSFATPVGRDSTA